METNLPPSRPHLVQLEADHPGFADPAYRARRDQIAAIAVGYESGQPVPQAPYSAAEEEVWRVVWRELAPRHARRVCRELNELQAELGLARGPLPQLEDLNQRLAPATGFRMEPVEGLADPRDFFLGLGRGIFLSTQYIRHSSRPLYTPEPDIVHEAVGHAASLMHAGIAELNRRFGRAAEAASEAELERLIHVYWYALEFSLVREAGEPRALGAGLLSSAGELDHSPAHLEWDLERMARTTFDPTAMQPALFVAPSFDELLASTSGWLERGAWRVSTPR